jgi:putative MFS transporter
MAAPLSSYQRRLLIFLGVASFFEGYDFFALSQVLPNIRGDFGLDQSDIGWLVFVVNLGTVVAYLLVRKADQWGRKRVLTITIAGYTLATLASGLAPDPYTFAIMQFVGRIFLIGEWAIAMVFAAEEFPAARRGMVIGVLTAIAALGSIVCAGVAPLLIGTSVGWRLVYLVSVPPLILLAIARRGLRESERFASMSVEERTRPRPFFAIFSSPYAGRVLLVASVWMFTYASIHTAVTYFKEYAVSDRGFTDAMVGQSITIAALVAMPLAFSVGALMDRIGRKPGAVLIFITSVGGVVGAYLFETQTAITIALVFGVFGATAVPAVLNAFSTELFPTEWRSDAFAWANNLLGRIGYVVAPLVVALVAEDTGWGPAVASTAVLPLVGLAVILIKFPETRGLELEQTAAIDPPVPPAKASEIAR